MNLLLDIGNSRCKFAILEEAWEQEYGTIAYTKSNKISDIEELLQDYKAIKKVTICSVLNNEFNQKLINILHAAQISDYYFLNPAVNTFGIQLCYQNPESLGADRLALLIAANVKYKGTKGVIDCGTAVTIDVINDEGAHQGGVIIPGIASMYEALSRNTDISHDGRRGSFNILSNSTQDAIYTGCISAVAGGIQNTLNLMQEHGVSFDKIIMTGGDTDIIMPMITQQIEREPRLVLDGLTFVMSEL